LEYGLYRERAHTLVDMGLGSARSFNVTGADDPERLRGASVDAGYLRTFGVRPVLGHLFSDEEDRPGGPALALIGYDLCQRRLGGRADVVGQTMRMEDRTYSIVGVLPHGFDVPYSAEVWVPAQTQGETLPFDERAATAHDFVARLGPGVGLEEADTEL